jgi:1,4-dihydroxy-2-naphthoyl-CoA hydrolase
MNDTAMPTSPAEMAERMNAASGGWNRIVGLRFVHVAADEVRAEWEVTEQHHQPYGIVHGGVYCTVIETVCSVGAAMFALKSGLGAVGLDNHTSFLHAVRSGKLTVTAKPLTRGRRTQLWEATVTEAQGRVAATGRVRLLCVESGSVLAGEKVSAAPDKV